MSDHNEPKLAQMSQFLTKTIDKEGTRHAANHLLHDTPPKPRGCYNDPSESALPKRKGYPAAGDQGAGFNYTPPSQAGHKV